MTYIEYERVKQFNYSAYCDYLLEKYGKVDGDYFSSNFTPNMSIKRSEEGLQIHHIREDVATNLSNVEFAKEQSFDFQRAENLVYANLIEHLFLHILIGEQNKGFGYGGAQIIIAKLNDIYNGFGEENDLADYYEVFEELKGRCRNGVKSYETLLEHNQTVFYELDDTLANNDRALVVIGTGLGKTTTALAYIRKYGLRALVLGPNTVITDAWNKETDVDVMTYQGFMNKYRTVDFSKYGVLICDEAHHCAAPRWGEGVRYVLDHKLTKVIGLTATPKEDKKDKANYEKSTNFFAGCVCEGFSVLDGIERGIIHDFSYVGAIYDTSDIREKYAGISDVTLLGELDLALNNTPTVKTILTKHMPDNKRKGIIFVSNIAAMDEAEEIMRDIYPNIEYRRIHSLMSFAEVEENRDWFQNTDEGYLLAVNMISEGAHYKGVNTIIMFRRTQSSLVFNQQLGRIITLARDEDPHAIVFDLVNNAENLDTEKSFCASLRESYVQRKARGGKEKSEQIIVEDYAETISDVLRKIKNGKREKWTEEDIALLIKYYELEGPDMYARFNGRFTREAVGCKARALNIHYQFSVVLRLDEKFNIEKRYEKVSLVEQDGYSRGGVLSCCARKQTKSGEKYWCYEKDYSEDWEPWFGKFTRNEAVYCIELDKEFENVKLASEFTGANYGHIRHCCHGLPQYNTAGGYHWCWAKDKASFVRRYDKDTAQCYCINDGKFFETLTLAADYYGCTSSDISSVCRGVQKTTRGLTFCYAKDYSPTLKPNKTKNKLVRCVETGITYSSISEAAENSICSRSCISASCKTGKPTKGYHWEYIK